MRLEDRIRTYYNTARQLIVQNKPRAARDYIVKILNDSKQALESNEISITSKVNAKGYLDKFMLAYQDLYEKGITDYVLRCFDLTAENVRFTAESPQIKRTTQPINIANQKGTAESLAKEWLQDLFQSNLKSVVSISISSGNEVANGTGFIISDKGYLLTNDHIVFDDNKGKFYPVIYMSFYEEKQKHRIEALFSSKKYDVALCRFNPNDVGEFSPVKRIADYTKISPGARCCMIGNAFGMGLAPIEGTIKFPNHDGNLIYNANSNPGDSGGPVFNIDGECIGINKSKTVAINKMSADGIINATPMDKINELLDKWTKANKVNL